MTKDYSILMWKKIFSSLGKPNDQRVIPNPGIRFNKDAKASRYDDMANDEFARLLDDVSAESDLFDNKPSASVMVLFLKAFSLITLERHELDHIADILSDATERATEEPEVPDSVPFI